MTALPTAVLMRRHALPAHFLADLDAERRPGAPSTRNLPETYPRLVATWHVADQGRPVCRWSVERAFSGPSG
jgi:hypothetical protein